MTSNNETVTGSMLTTVARDQRWPDVNVVAGISVLLSNFAAREMLTSIMLLLESRRAFQNLLLFRFAIQKITHLKLRATLYRLKTENHLVYHNKQHHMNVLLNSFHLNGHPHTRI